MSGRKIVTRHLIARTARRELAHLWRLQATDGPEAAAELARLGITTRTKLAVRQERKRLYKWAVVTA